MDTMLHVHLSHISDSLLDHGLRTTKIEHLQLLPVVIYHDRAKRAIVAARAGR
jgi:hypothetical protein